MNLKFIRANKTKFGGAEVYLYRVAEELQKRKIGFELVHSSISKKLPSWFRVLLFNFQVCRDKDDSFYFSLERITCPDIYRAGDGVHKVFLEIEKKSRLNPLHKAYLFLEKRCFNNSKKIIAISNMVKQNIIDTYDIDPSKIHVVYNGINLVNYNFDNSFEKLSTEFNIQKDTKILSFVGSGFKRKGVEEFLNILSRLEYNNFKAFIVGKEKKIGYYKNLAQKLNIFDKVIFTGPRTDVNDFYTISDIFLFPTKYEPFGNVILEAMNFSNAVFTTRTCGGGEVLDQDFIMNSPDDYEVSKKIDILLKDQEKLDSIKLKNMETVKNFSIEKNVEETLDVINEVIKMKESK